MQTTSSAPDFPMAEDGILAGLNKVQCDFMLTVTHARAEIADYLRRGVQVVAYQHDEDPEVPPFALAVADEPSFWIGCFMTENKALTVAGRIGLQVQVAGSTA